MNRHLVLICILIGFGSVWGQSSQNIWQEINPTTVKTLDRQKPFPLSYKAFQLDFEQIKAHLSTAPLEGNSQNQTLRFSMPGPDGQLHEFDIVETLVMPTSLGALFPEIKTFLGESVTEPGTFIRLDYTYLGFHAKIRSPKYNWWIEPVTLTSLNTYLGFFQKYANASAFGPGRQCGVQDEHLPEFEVRPGAGQRNGTGAQLRTYRCAFASDERFTDLHGGKPQAISAITSTINFINDIYESELAIRLTLVPNNNLLIFDSSDDPYSANNSPLSGTWVPAMLAENQGVIDGIIGTANYDIGQVFSRSFGSIAGIAGTGSVCSSSRKANSVSTASAPVGLGFFQTMAHETGHQFSARHTFNSEVSNCNGNRVSSSAFEPGDGTTILSYDGCEFVGTDQPYFHTHSYQQIITFSNAGLGNSCANITSTTNEPPTVDAGEGGWVLPVETPFVLHAGPASDPNGDALTYCWEQYDRVSQTSPLNSPVGNSPIFRSFLPTTDSFRIFPKMGDIVSGLQTPGELMPTYSRDLTFRLTVRDGRQGGGGVAYDQIAMTVTDQAGPFRVTKPDVASPALTAGEVLEIEWDVANTDQAPVNCQKVDILMSTDGGFTYNMVLAEGVPNDGSYKVCVPNNPGFTNRIQVKAADHIFFDISNQNFQIIAPATNGFSFLNNDKAIVVCQDGSTPLEFESCEIGTFTEKFGVSAIGLPSGVSLIANPDSVTPGNSFNITFEASAFTPVGNYNVGIRGITASGRAFIQFVPLEIFPSFADAPIATALNGTNDAPTSPTLDWAAVPSIGTYYFELSADPTFSNILASGVVNETKYAVPFALAGLTTYYWRVAAVVDCGNGPFSPIYAFRTGACSRVSSTDVPKIIDPFGTPPIEVSSVLSYTGPAPSDINVFAKGTHTRVKDLVLTLTSPGGIEITLMNAICGENDEDFDLLFDSESSITNIPCPPSEGAAVKPSQPLTFFYNNNPDGDWTLNVKDFNNFNGGELTEWGLEFCQELNSDLAILNNDLLYPPLNSTRAIFETMLKAVSTNVVDADITFTLVTNPAYGSLSVNGTPINPGDTFTQADIANTLLEYTQNGTVAPIDSFFFIVEDPNGGWIGTEEFRIGILTDIEGITPGFTIQTRPNPVTQILQVSLSGVNAPEASVRMLDLQGREVELGQKQIRLVDGQADMSLDLSQLASGIYFLEVQTGDERQVQKIVKN